MSDFLVFSRHDSSKRGEVTGALRPPSFFFFSFFVSNVLEEEVSWGGKCSAQCW